MKTSTALFLLAFCVLQQQVYADTPASEFDTASAAQKAHIEELHVQSLHQKQQAHAWAQKYNRPLVFERDNVLYELMAVENGYPLYNITHNENAAISTAADLVRNTAPYSVNGSGITVGVWDGGHALTTHQEFDGRVTTNDTGGSSGVNYHSTHVAGTIAAINNTIGVVGVAAGATVIPVRVLDKSGSGTIDGVIAGVDYVAGTRPFSFPILVQPILDEKCAGCHTANIKKGNKKCPDLRIDGDAQMKVRKERNGT